MRDEVIKGQRQLHNNEIHTRRPILRRVLTCLSSTGLRRVRDELRVSYQIFVRQTKDKVPLRESICS